MASAIEPYLDFDHLPKLPDEQTLVRWLTEAALMYQLMQQMNSEADPNSFEWEERQAILR